MRDLQRLGFMSHVYYKATLSLSTSTLHQEYYMASTPTEPSVHVGVYIARANPKNHETECRETTSDVILRQVTRNRRSDAQFTLERLVWG